jgi:sugar/nucleoside kinase (ribokinase family)
MVQKYDLLSVGELLVDLISEGFADTFAEVTDFKRIPGGSPANLCMNMARLGGKTRLVAGVGNDDMGGFLYDYVAALGVNCDYLEKKSVPTTLILVTRSKSVSNFEAYRGADAQIGAHQLDDEVLKASRIFHTTCFGLSIEPAQSVIMDAAKRAFALGVQLSIDANYAQKIWKNQAQAQATVEKYCSMGALVKVSDIDWERLYNQKLTDYKAAAAHFLTLGAREVCVTLGGDGCYVASPTEAFFLPARKVEVKDTTGAGDAFWSGYLTAWCDGYSLHQKAQAARRMAELKLAYFGPLPSKVEKSEIYEFE